MSKQIITPNDFKECADDSAMIQAAVDSAAKSGASVTIPQLNERTGKTVWNIVRAVRLHSNSVVCLDNCCLRQAEGVFCNIFKNSNADKAISQSTRQYDICIYGVGNAILDGGEPNGLTESTYGKNGLPHIFENCMINFVNTERVRIENIGIKNQRYWAMVFHYCSHGAIEKINFAAFHTVPNQDGIDLRTGCSHFIINNITGCTGDDTVALTCLKSIFDDSAAKEGYDNSIHNITVKNICSSTPCSLVRLLNHDGRKLYNIIVENITVLDRFGGGENAHFRFRPGAAVRIGENYYYKERKSTAADTHNIIVRNVFGRARTSVRISCGLSCSEIENIHVTDDGGTAVYFGEGHYEELVVKDIFYAPDNRPELKDDNRAETHFNQCALSEAVSDREVCAVYFKQAGVENIFISNVFAGKHLTAVFGGIGKGGIAAAHILKDENVPLITAAGIELKK